jgi:hypothetical protein
MMYNKEWAFLHIPKTSGSNFKKHLKENMHVGHPKLQDPRYMFIHEPISFWVDNGTIPEGYQWITIVRNPYSRLVSWYYFLKRQTIDPVTGGHAFGKRQSFEFQNSYYTFENFIKSNVLSVSKGGAMWENFERAGGLWRRGWTQSRFIEGDHKVRIFHIEDLSELEDFVGFKFAHTRHNTSFSGPWEDHYTKETRDIVYERYREDFENFGYDR